MKRQKMITLCPTSYEIAKGMTNFSHWVRRQLLAMEIHDDISKKHQYACTDCDTILHTHHELDGVPHATKRLGEFMHESCHGFFVKVS